MTNFTKLPEIEVFLGSFLKFEIRVFIWGLENDDYICKKYEDPLKTIILSNWINNTINLKQHNIKSARTVK